MAITKGKRRRVVSPQAAYEEAAAYYDERDWAPFWRAHEQPIVNEFLGDVAGKRIVDYGCGTGQYLIPCLRAGADFILGIDASSRMLSLLEARLQELPEPEQRRVQLECCQMEKEISIPGQFDIALFIRSLSNVQHARAALHKAALCVSAQGIIIVSDIHPAAEYTVTAMRDPATSQAVYTTAYHRSVQDYEEFFRGCGFRLHHYRQAPIKPEWGMKHGNAAREKPEQPIFYVAVFGGLR